MRVNRRSYLVATQLYGQGASTPLRLWSFADQPLNLLFLLRMPIGMCIDIFEPKYPISQEGQQQLITPTNVVVFVNKNTPGLQGLLEAVSILTVEATHVGDDNQIPFLAT
jgi:hypothetical protein